MHCLSSRGLIIEWNCTSLSLCNETIVIGSSIKETVGSNWHWRHKSIYQVWFPRNVAIQNPLGPVFIGDLEILNNFLKINKPFHVTFCLTFGNPTQKYDQIEIEIKSHNSPIEF